jgi:hypothetical protein
MKSRERPIRHIFKTQVSMPSSPLMKKEKGESLRRSSGLVGDLSVDEDHLDLGPEFEGVAV